jgi:hypothetical protein
VDYNKQSELGFGAIGNLNVANSLNYFRALKLYLKMQDRTHACYLVRSLVT